MIISSAGVQRSQPFCVVSEVLFDCSVQHQGSCAVQAAREGSSAMPDMELRSRAAVGNSADLYVRPGTVTSAETIALCTKENVVIITCSEYQLQVQSDALFVPNCIVPTSRLSIR